MNLEVSIGDLQWKARWLYASKIVSCNGCEHDNIASWAVHIMSHASDVVRCLSSLVSLSIVMFLMSQFRSAVEMHVVIVALLSWRITEMTRR